MSLLLGSNLTSGSASNSSSVTTNSISPAGNGLVLVGVTSVFNGGTPNTPTISGYTQVATKNNTAHVTTTLFRSLSQAPSSGTLTIDFSSQSQTTVYYIIDQITRTDTSGSNGAGAIVQNAVGSLTNGGNSTGLTLTLNAFGNALNGTYGVLGMDQGLSPVVGSNFTQLASVSSSMVSQFAANNQTSVPWTWTSNAVNVAAVAVEIKAIQGFLGTMI